MRMLESRITVPARLMNDHPRSHIALNTFVTLGAWYAGSSITNGAGSPSKGFVFFSIIPDTIIAATPIKYAEVATMPDPPNTALAMSATIGILAPHGIKVVVIIVILRSLSFSMVRDAITPGMPQPEPTSIGINDLPERPNLRKILSMINAIRAI